MIYNSYSFLKFSSSQLFTSPSPTSRNPNTPSLNRTSSFVILLLPIHLNITGSIFATGCGRWKNDFSTTVYQGSLSILILPHLSFFRPRKLPLELHRTTPFIPRAKSHAGHTVHEKTPLDTLCGLRLRRCRDTCGRAFRKRVLWRGFWGVEMERWLCLLGDWRGLEYRQKGEFCLLFLFGLEGLELCLPCPKLLVQKE